MLSLTDGAIFDHLLRYIKTPLDVYDAFENGFAGCPSIDRMETPTVEYGRWRAGGDRHKKFYEWKLVVNDIREQTQNKVDQLRLAKVIHVNYNLQGGKAISSLAKLIREKNVRKAKKT